MHQHYTSPQPFFNEFSPVLTCMHLGNALIYIAFHVAESRNWEETFVPIHGDGTQTPSLASSHESVLGVCRTRHD